MAQIDFGVQDEVFGSGFLNQRQLLAPKNKVNCADQAKAGP